MYNNFFGVREAPFNDNPDPRYLYRTRQTQKALDDLTDGIQARKGCILLTGEVGTGKTTLVNCLRKSLERWEIPTAFLFNSHLSTENLLEFMLIEFRIPYDIRLKGNLLLFLNNWLVGRFNAGATPVLIVDEAQGLTLEGLEEIRLLLNLETSSQKLLQVVLAGQPELEKRLQREELRQLRQRIAVRCKTAPLTCEETHHYVQERLRIAGAANPCVFEFAAMDTAYRYSGGIPRVLNLLCEEALIRSYAHQVRPVPDYIVQHVAHELELEEIADSDSPSDFVTAVRPDFLRWLSAWPAESPSPLCSAPANVDLGSEEAESEIAGKVLCSVGSVAGESPLLPQNDANLLGVGRQEAESKIASEMFCFVGSVAEESELPPQHDAEPLLSLEHQRAESEIACEVLCSAGSVAEEFPLLPQEDAAVFYLEPREDESKIAHEIVGSVVEEFPLLPQEDAGLLSPEHGEAESKFVSQVLCSAGSVAEESPMPVHHDLGLLSIEHDVPPPPVMKIPAKRITVLQPKQKKETPRSVKLPSESPVTEQLRRLIAAYEERVSSMPRLVSSPRAVPPKKAAAARQFPAPFHTPRTAHVSSRIGALHAASDRMCRWNRALDLWWTKHFSRQLCWKTFISAALAGSILLVLAPGLSVLLPGWPFARVLCGFAGLLFWAVSLGFGAWLILYSTALPSQIAGRWSKPFAMLLRWLREPTHL